MAGVGVPVGRGDAHRGAGGVAVGQRGPGRGEGEVVEFVSTLGHDLAPSAGKSRDAVRTIDLDAGLVAVLRCQERLQASEREAAGDRWQESGYVFTMPDGGQCHPQYLSRTLGRYSSELGLPRLTAHGLRHTSATLMLASGVPAKVAAERLGHADPSVVVRSRRRPERGVMTAAIAGPLRCRG